ncbi:MAG: O-antigen ligase family protein [Deltaproteobacteria bacterium]|nr:O-antigen ligase family protein [Deltaproteobacteria bacterium]
MRTRDRLSAYLGLGALLVGVLAIGGASRVIVVIVLGLAALAAAGQLASRRKLDGVSPLMLFLGLAVGLTALQLIPLPPGLRSMLSETGHDLISDGRILLGVDAATVRDEWRPLSLDPSATLVELAKMCAYLLLAWMALRAAASERGRYRLLAAVAGTAGIVTVVALLHELLGARTLYGIYAPAHVSPIVMAPLLNANHLACLMVLGAITAAGLALHERKAPAMRVVWIAVAIGCIGVILATRSRGGIIGFGGGATVMAVLIVLQRLRESRDTSRRDVLRVAIPAVVTVMCTLVLVVYLGGDKVRDELADTRLDELSDPRSKYAAWDSAIDLFREAPVLGIGRGAFETSFTRVHPASGQVTFSHVENEYVQTLVDWGVVGAIAFAFAIGFAALFLLRRWHRGSLTAAAIGGLAAISAQSLVDFGLELPGLAIPTILVASTILYVPVREASASAARGLMRIAVIGAAVVVGLIAASSRGTTVGEDHRDLRDAPTLELAKEAFARHPVDYLAVAVIGSSSKDPKEQISSINHALRLHPAHPDLHLVVARWLAATKRFSQSALEYRFALQRGVKVELLVSEVIARLPAADVPRAFPNGTRQWGRIAKALVDQKRVDLAVAFLEVSASDEPRRGREFWSRLYTLANLIGRNEPALRGARELAKLEPSPKATLQVANVQVKLEDLPGALATLHPITSAPASSPAHVEAHLLTCKIRVTRREWAEAKQCLDATLQLAAVNVTSRRALHAELAKVEAALGNERGARLERELSGQKD